MKSVLAVLLCVGYAVATYDKLIKQGDDLMAKGRSSYNQALKVYSEALEAAPVDGKVRVFLKRAELYELLKQYGRAVSDLTEVLKLKSAHKAAYKMRAKINTLLGEFQLAANDWQALAAEDKPKERDHLAQAGLMSSHAQQKQRITAALKTVAALDVHQRRGVYEECIRVYTEFAKITKGLESSRIQLVECMMNADSRIEQARVEIDTLLKKDPSSLAGLYLKAKLLNRQGAVDVARKVLSKCFSLEQDYEPCQRMSKLIKGYSKLVEGSKKSMEEKHYDEAIKRADEGLALDSFGFHTFDFLKLRCEAYLKLKKIDQGLQACTRCIESEEGNPQRLSVYLMRSDVHVLNDDLESAKQDIQKAKDIENNNQVNEYEQKMQRLEKMKSRKDFYKILGVPKTASTKEIKSSFKKLAMKYHPDKVRHLPENEQKTAEQKYRDIQEAKDVLSDEEKRGKYDRGEDLNPQQQQQQPFHGFQGFGGQQFHFRFG